MPFPEIVYFLTKVSVNALTTLNQVSILVVLQEESLAFFVLLRVVSPSYQQLLHAWHPGKDEFHCTANVHDLNAPKTERK